ncbi:fucolectin-like [Pecten maximus]|uniref:fucolectin-like n=1 Tax=Pecten maximus TaxID=6579 RepID=UPI0014582A9A|nr:fucolectin-like [Pecten maximus]
MNKHNNYIATVHGYFFSRVISNVALNKPTTQSSTLNASSLAVDGFVDPPTCMSTSGTGYQWWQVDLGAVYTITNVSIQGNIGKHDGLRNFTVELSKTNTSDVRGYLLNAILCYNFTQLQVPEDHIITLPCPRDTIGRFLRISKMVEILDDTLTFCEVVVEVSRDECNLADIALNKPATQSSVGWGGVAGRAVDGNLNPDYHAAMSCMHTSLTDDKPWWQVDLGGVYSINHVSLQNILRSGKKEN